jgi:hypothetical protein
LMIEQTTQEIADHIGFMLKPNKERVVRNEWSTPSNTTKELIADFITLGLIEPSKKKHSLKDKEEYWTLTETGRGIHAHIRRLVLEGEEPVAASPAGAKPESKPEANKK